MALTGKFIADFSSFYDAVNKAEVELKGLETGANKVGPALNRMVDQFSGRKLIQDATLMARAIEEIGGVSKLTEKELQRVGSTMQDALTKMRAAGEPIPANLQRIADATKTANTAGKDWMGTLTTMAGVAGVTFSVGSVIAWGKAMLDAAGQLTKLSDQTGISVEALQMLQVAGDDAGNTVDELAGAVSQMQLRMAGGEDSAANALAKLGLEFENLKRLTPDQILMRISDAIRQVEDPAEQARLAVDLFGKQGLAVLPTLKRGFDDLKDSVHGMSEGTVEDLESAGDAITRWGRNATNWFAEIIVRTARLATSAPGQETRDIMKALDASMVAAQREAEANFRRTLPKPLTVTAPGAQEAQDIAEDLDWHMKREAEARAKSEKAALAQAEAQKKLNAEIRQYNNWIVEREFADVAEQMRRVAAATAEAAKQQAVLNTWIHNSSTSLERFVGIDFTPLKEGMLSWLPTTGLEQGPSLFAGLGKSLTSGIASSVMGALQGGGNVLQSVGATIGNIMLDPKQSGLGGAIAKQVGKLPGVLGSTLSSIMPMVGTFLGPAVELAAKGIGKLFGRDEEATTVNPMRDKFIAAAGGLHALNVQAQEAGISLEAMLRADTVEEYEAAIRELQAALDLQVEATEEVKAAMDRWGLSVTDMGLKFAQSELDKQALALVQDFRLLEAAGADVERISVGMASSINEYVAQAQQAGATIPAAMHDIIQQLITQGLLLDANGDAYTSMEDAGLTFAETMDQQFKTLIDRIDDLVEALEHSLGGAIRNVPDVSVEGTVHWNVPNVPTPSDVDVNADVPGFAAGTHGEFLDFGKGTLAMLHGKEAVVPQGEAVGGADMAALRTELQGLRADLIRQQRLLPKQLRDALLLAS